MWKEQALMTLLGVWTWLFSSWASSQVYSSTHLHVSGLHLVVCCIGLGPLGAKCRHAVLQLNAGQSGVGGECVIGMSWQTVGADVEFLASCWCSRRCDGRG